MSSPHSTAAIAEGMLRAKQGGGSISTYLSSALFANLSEEERKDVIRRYLADPRAHSGMSAKGVKGALKASAMTAVGEATPATLGTAVALTAPTVAGHGLLSSVTRKALLRNAGLAALGIGLPTVAISTIRGAQNVQAFNKNNQEVRKRLQHALDSEDMSDTYEVLFTPKLPKAGLRQAIVQMALTSASKGALYNAAGVDAAAADAGSLNVDSN